MRTISSIVWCLALLACTRPVPAHEEDSLPPDTHTPGPLQMGEVIDDRAIGLHLREAGLRLLNAGRAVPIQNLRQQLGRTQCQLQLPRPRQRHLSAAALVENQRSSVVVLAANEATDVVLLDLEGLGPRTCTIAPLPVRFVAVPS